MFKKFHPWFILTNLTEVDFSSPGAFTLSKQTALMPPHTLMLRGLIQ